MPEKFVFLAGLPRTGSTLLSSILEQNPRIHSRGSSPVAGLMETVEKEINKSELFQADPKVDDAKNVVASVLPNYYATCSKEVVLDKNRSWVARTGSIEYYFGRRNIIVMHRPIDEILASFLKLIKQNPDNTYDKSLKNAGRDVNDVNRCLHIIDTILRGLAIKILEIKDLDNVLMVSYKDITQNTEETLEKIYTFIGEPAFAHDLDNIQHKHRERDQEVYGIGNLHEVRSTVSVTSPPRDSIPRCISQMIDDDAVLSQFSNL